MSAHLGDVVDGVSVEVGEKGVEIGEGAEVHRVKKVYKIGCAKGGKAKGGVKGGNGDKGKEDRRDIEAVVLGAMALKGE